MFAHLWCRLRTHHATTVVTGELMGDHMIYIRSCRCGQVSKEFTRNRAYTPRKHTRQQRRI